MTNALPAILWLIGAAGALLVCAITVYSSHYFNDTDKPVYPVSWYLVGAHFVTLIMLALPYPIYLSTKDAMSAHSRALYQQLGWWSAGIAIALVFAELALMYAQARRAYKSELKAQVDKGANKSQRGQVHLPATHDTEND